MTKYNKLTRMLLEKGYSVENYPKDKVRIAGGCYSKNNNPLENMYGGFEYIRKYADSIVYQTGCGLFVKGSHVISNMGFQGEEWSHENDNPVIRCPHDKANCRENDPRLYGEQGGGLCIQCFCVCHQTKKRYVYEQSFEYEQMLLQAEKEKKYQEFADARKGIVCERHMYYDERKREWHMRYEPESCARLCYSQNGYCPILGKNLSKKRGNVYYDLKITGKIEHNNFGEQTSLFDGNSWSKVEKGIRYFDKPCSIDICDAFVGMRGKAFVQADYERKHSFEMFAHPDKKIEILNVRAESKASRDLMHDLQDIQNGIAVIHASDSEKKEKVLKKEKREAAKKKRIARLEKKLLAVGYENLPNYSSDKIHADKWLGDARIAELAAIRKQNIQKEEEKLVQGSIWDCF